MSDNISALSDQLLIAMPQLRDPFFANSVIYLWEHSDEGALGVAINLPLSITLTEVFEQMDIIDERPENSTQTVLSGGPVETSRGFILHDTPTKTKKTWDSTIDIANGLHITTSRDVLEDIAQGEGPENYLVILGCSGWSAGQLEKEVADNAWLTCPASKDIIFSPDLSNKAKLAAAKLGFDISQLTSDTGSS